MDIYKLKKDVFEMKLKALDMAQSTSFGAHIGGGFSAMEMMACLYEVANIPSMADESRDRIILSKGHGVFKCSTVTSLCVKNLIDFLLTSFNTSFHGFDLFSVSAIGFHLGKLLFVLGDLLFKFINILNGCSTAGSTA